MSLSSAWLRQV